MICGLGGHYAVAAALAKSQARAQSLANMSGLGQLQQAGLNQMIRASMPAKPRTREDKILDMEIDLSRYLNKSNYEG